MVIRHSIGIALIALFSCLPPLRTSPELCQYEHVAILAQTIPLAAARTAILALAVTETVQTNTRFAHSIYPSSLHFSDSLDHPPLQFSPSIQQETHAELLPRNFELR